MILQWLSEDIVRLLGTDLLVVSCPIFSLQLVLTYCFNLIVLLKSDANRLLLIGILYIVAHIESWLNQSHNIIVPLNLDITLISLSYFALVNMPREY